MRHSIAVALCVSTISAGCIQADDPAADATPELTRRLEPPRRPGPLVGSVSDGLIAFPPPPPPPPIWVQPSGATTEGDNGEMLRLGR
jgi:hypothetical protein